MKMNYSWLEELTSSTEDSSEDDAQPILLWVPLTVQSSRQETVDLFPKTESVCGCVVAVPRVPIVLSGQIRLEEALTEAEKMSLKRA